MDLPEALVEKIGGKKDLSQQVREALAVDAYLSGRLTRRQVAEVLGMNFYQVEKWFANYPVVANGRFYIRDTGTIWCYDVKGKDLSLR